MRKMNFSMNLAFPGLALAGLLMGGAALAAEQPVVAPSAPSAPSTSAVKPQLQIRPAEHRPAAVGVKILAASRAGTRIVAAGDHGVVLLSDDEGASFHQAHTVPVRSTLTALAFVDANNGWAVGHWAQRPEPTRRRPVWRA